ncbi:MAG: 1,4-beta-glucanase [Acidobacteria bacterium]|nr:MAG: 1,4-beta-glucanase [Acidobacteriota bacterium]
MASWNINTVRIPLNEHCWLGINGANPASSGATYQNAIVNFVNLLHQFNLYAILDLHWGGPGTTLAIGRQVMADQDHSPAFWTSVATKFKNDPAVLFDLYNEPNTISDSCWRDGCTTSDGWLAVGMQSLVNTVRATGATQPILISGNGHGNDLSGWLNFKPNDPLLSLVASPHTYNFNECVTESCWNSTFRPVAAVVPFVSAEIGEDDCAHGFIDTYMSWLDSVGAGYLGWGWVTAPCGTQPSLILDYSGTPTNYGIGLRNHLLNLTTQPALNSLTLK